MLHIIHDAGMGGAQVLLRDIVQYWRKKEVELVVLTHLKGHYLEDYQALCRVYSIDFKQSSISLIVAIRKILNLERPEVVHTHLWKAVVLVSASVFGKISATKIYHQIHGVVADTNRAAWKLHIYQLFLRRIGRTSARFIAVSDYEVQRLQEGGVPSNHIQRIYNGVAVKHFSYSPKKYIKGEPLKLLFVGRLEHLKGITFLLAAMKHLPSAKLLLNILGEGRLKSELEDYCIEHNLRNVHFSGFTKDVRSHIAEHHVVVMPSLWEVFGISIAEAMAMGKAIIGTDVGGIPELIIPEKGGYLCEPASVQDLKAAILKFLNTPAKVAQFGAFNRRRFEEKFTFQQTLNSLEQLYEKE
ncbi:MAG: glycosyltransferase [Bacteroidota bacterium]